MLVLKLDDGLFVCFFRVSFFPLQCVANVCVSVFSSGSQGLFRSPPGACPSFLGSPAAGGTRVWAVWRPDCARSL